MATLLLDVLAPVVLGLSAWAAARSWPGQGRDEAFAFLFWALLGWAAGFRVAWAAFRWGRRRRGRDPQPRPPEPDDVVRPFLRFIGCSVGSLLSAGLGFVLWALAVAFLRSLE